MRRTVDIVISALVGGIVGAVVVFFRPLPPMISVDTLFAKKIIVRGDEDYISIDGDTGISLQRADYASALLWFREPGTGDPGTGGPVLLIVSHEPQAFKATPSGEGMVPANRDESKAP